MNAKNKKTATKTAKKTKVEERKFKVVTKTFSAVLDGEF